MMKRRTRFMNIVTFAMICMLLLPLQVAAMSGKIEGEGEIISPTVSENIISVTLPTVGEESPFNFFIDPQHLIFKTSAMKYGGGIVEENANLLFHNHDVSEYDFSKNSDILSVSNRSTVPVEVTVTAKITELGDVKMAQDKDFGNDEGAVIYLALIDDEGNEQPLSDERVISVSTVLEKVPSNFYIWKYDEISDSYKYVSNDDANITCDEYSFGLTGECNQSKEWENISSYLKLEVTWQIEPILPEGDANL